MAIKVEILNEKDKKINYPFIGISTASYNLIVLFNDTRSGFVLSPGNSSYDVGAYSDSWFEDCFKKFEGKITLSND